MAKTIPIKKVVTKRASLVGVLAEKNKAKQTVKLIEENADAVQKSGTSPKKDAFSNKQLDIFQSFYVNTNEQRSNASNSIELWDGVPRYSISQIAMNKMRDKGRLGLLELDFFYEKNKLKTIIQPALIVEEIEGIKTTVSYYPSANEELIEEALRKIASLQQMGFHEPAKRSGVVFTLYQLREELKQRGHSRSYGEIVKSLNILSGSIIEIIGGAKNKSFSKSAYFPSMTGVTYQDLKDDPKSKWHVQFHPLVTDAIDKLSYRQFNYQQLMSHTTQLARWLHKYLVRKYSFASKMKPFEIRYSTIKKDSLMLNNYSQERDAIKACDFSMSELENQKIASQITRKTVTGARNKILDVVYTILPTNDFVSEVKAANARQGQLKNQ